MITINNGNVEVLNELYKSTKMGMQAIDTMTKKMDDTPFKGEMTVHNDHYSILASDIRRELSKLGETPADASALSKATLWGSIQINTLGNQSSGKVAEMMINGSNMGIVGVTKKVNDHPEVDHSIRKIADGYVKLEQKYIDTMKQYL